MNTKLVLVAAMAFTLVACSGGPSSSDIESALQDQVRSEMAQQAKLMEQFGGKKAAQMAKSMMGGLSPEDVEITDLETEDLKALDNGDYEADITFTTEAGERTQKQAARIRMTEVGGTWKVIAMQQL